MNRQMQDIFFCFALLYFFFCSFDDKNARREWNDAHVYFSFMSQKASHFALSPENIFRRHRQKAHADFVDVQAGFVESEGTVSSVNTECVECLILPT